MYYQYKLNFIPRINSINYVNFISRIQQLQPKKIENSESNFFLHSFLRDNTGSDTLTVPDPGKGVCADPVNRGAILEGEGPGPPSGDKERQLSPDKRRGKT